MNALMKFTSVIALPNVTTLVETTHVSAPMGICQNGRIVSVRDAETKGAFHLSELAGQTGQFVN